ncbi:MAG: InlB B-repeat-containing protein, partial [Paludibacteraceae bacterium]
MTVQGDLAPLVVVSKYCIEIYNSNNNRRPSFIESANADEYVIKDFVVPDKDSNGNWPMCWVGENNEWSDEYSENWTVADIPLTADNALKLGLAAGAVGTLHIWENNSGKNKGLQFTPAGYGMSWQGGDGTNWVFLPFTYVSGNCWQTELVTLTKTAENSGQYWVGYQASTDYVYSSTRSSTLNIKEIGTIAADGKISGNISSLVAGTKGKFEIYDTYQDANWYAHFIPYYHVVYDEQGGSEVADGEFFAVNAGVQSITLPTPTLDGYVFKGWSDGSKTYTGTYSFTPTADITLTAVWDKLYTVTYDLNGGSGNTPTQASLCAGETFTVASAEGITKAGYTFAGWSDGTNTYAAAETYTMGSADITLTAVWEETPYWTLRGSFESDDTEGWAKDHDFVETETTGIATYAISLAENTQYKFKVKYGSTWYGLSGGGYYTSTFNDCKLSSSASDNVVFTTGRAGTYLFTLNTTNASEPQISVTYPTLKATTQYLIANAGVSAGALAANLAGAEVGVIKYDGTTYATSEDISLNTYPGTKTYYYAETHLDHLGTEQDWSETKTSSTTVQALKFSTGTYTLQLGSLTATKIAFYGRCDKARTLTIAGVAKEFSSGFIAQEVSGSFTGDVDIKTSGEIYGVLLIDVEAGERCSTPAVAITSGFNDGTRTTYCADDADFKDWAGWTATITVEGMGADEQCLVAWVNQSNPTDTLQTKTYMRADGNTANGTTTFTSTYRAPAGGTYDVRATVSASGKTSTHAQASAQLRLLTAPATPTLTATVAQGDVAQGDVVKMTSSSNTNLWQYSADKGSTWTALATTTALHTWSPSQSDDAGEYRFRCYAQNTNIEGCNQSKEPSNVLTYKLLAVAQNVPILTVTNNGTCEKDGGATLTASHITTGATLAWFKDGAALTDYADKTEIQVTESGSYTVVATVDGIDYASTPAAVTVRATAKITTDL